MSDKLKKKVKVHKVGTSFDCTKQFINAIRHCSDFINYSCAISDDEINIKIKFKPNRQKEWFNYGSNVNGCKQNII